MTRLADIAWRVAHPSGLCRNCWWRPAVAGWPTCSPCFFQPERWRVPCTCTPPAARQEPK